MNRKRRSEKNNRFRVLLLIFLIIGVFAMVGCSSETSGEKAEGDDKYNTNADSTEQAGNESSAGNMAADEGSADVENNDLLPRNTGRPTIKSGEKPSEPGTTGYKSAEETSGEEAGNRPDTGHEEGKVPGDDTDSEDSGEADDNSFTEENSSTISAEDDSPWSNSFLLFLPRFTAGEEENRVSEETFDHIIIGGVDSKRTIEDYVEEVKAAGFNVDADYVDHNGEIDFHAYNKDGWYVIVDYDIGTSKVDIACGFFDEKEEKTPASYFDEEILSVVPMPEAGTLSSGRADKESPYALYEECTLEDAKEYAKALVKAGFDKEVEEGEADGVYWYNAEGPDGIVCDMQYADGMIVIICDKTEE